MQITLLLQSIFYDRPRQLQSLQTSLKTVSDVREYIHSLSYQDAFRSEALLRLNKREEMIHHMTHNDIGWLGMEHDHYPPQFHQLHDPPLGVFYRGQLLAHSLSCCGMVGSRRASVMAPYRIESIMRFVSGYCIVAGGALGVDAMVHDQALVQHLPTIAVLASGLDAMVPRTNQALFQRIIDSGQGCIISECPPGVCPKPYYFPQRNRLIAALSSKLIVIEAAKRSGALLTANLALGMAADVAAMVGAFNAPQSEGCYDLINDGAAIIGNHTDLLRFLDIDRPCVNELNHNGCDLLGQFLDEVPVEPIHMDDLANRLCLSMDQVIENVTRLSLNGDVIISSGQWVSRRV